jgi:hypothetical protein
VAAAQSAMATKDGAERSMRVAEAALATERATRVRTEGMLRDAQATIKDLREKLATANQNLRGMQSELDAEREARPTDDAAPGPAIAMPETVMAPVRDVAVSTVRRPVGRPRKTVVVGPVPMLIMHLDESSASPGHKTPPNQNAIVQTIRRSVGRPRKTAVVLPVQKPITPPTKAQAPIKPITKKATSRADDQEPIQWWIEGWKRR